MNEALKAAMLANSQARTKLNTLQSAENRDAPAVATAEAEWRESEEAYRTALADVPDDPAPVDDSEHRERLELREKSSLTAYIAAAVEGTSVTGAEAELSAACGCKAGFLPLDMLETRELPPLEHRAVTPLPASGEYQGAQAAVIPPVFERTAAAALGTMFPVVEQGTALYPAISTAPPVGVKAKSAAAAATASAFTLATRVPRRVTGRFTVRVEDLALFPPMESALRSALVGSAGDAIDDEVFNGAAADFTTDGEIRGLFAQAANVTIATATETFNTGIARYAALVDGEYAYGWNDLRLVLGSATFAQYAGLFNNTQKGDISLFDYLAGKVGSVRVTNRVPAKSANGQKGLVTLNATGQAIRVPVWRGIQLIRDQFTDSAKGEIHITAYVLIGSPFVPHGASMLKEVHPKIS